MKDLTFPYRQAIYEALSGNVTYNSFPVPVTSALSEAEQPYYIVINSLSIANQSNKHRFIHAATIQLEVVDYATRAASYKAVSDIFGQIMAILAPSPWTAGFVIDSDFQAVNVEITGHTDLFEPSFQKVVRKIIEIRSEIVQLS